jgi:IPT/TIG domain
MSTTALSNGRPRGRAVVVGILLALTGSPAPVAAKGPPPPLVGHVDPERGPAAGGTPVTVTGSNFRPGARLWLGGVEAAEVVVVSDHRITAVAPPHRPGRVDVAVRNVDWQEGGRGWSFTYGP